MAKKLKVLRGRPGRFELHEREAATNDPLARESIQAHIVLQRFPAFAIAREKLAAGYDFSLDKDGLVKVFLKSPITQEDHRRMIVEGKLAVGDTERAAFEQAKVRVPFAHRALNVVSITTKMGCYSFNLPAGPPSFGGTCPAAGLGFMFMNSSELRQFQKSLSESRPINVPDYICNGCVVGDTKVLVRDRGLVTVQELEAEDSLFEVWSGKAWRSARAVFTGFKPVFELTTSWGAKLQLTADHQVLTEDRGWVEARDLEEGDRLVEPCIPEAASPRDLPTVKSLEKVSDLEVPVFDLQVDTDHAFVANDIVVHNCYALKNSYGNPSQVMFQAVRYMLVLEWLHQGTFVARMVDAIQATREKSRRQLKRLPAELRWTVPHPDFFRIHDSGDFFSPEYTKAWFEICRSLPDVHFWAPTRMWAMKKSSSVVFEKGVPANLALRPSALHFGEKAPIPPSNLVRKLATGSGSGKHVPKGTWKCPAYEHLSTGGGLGPRVTRKGTPKLTKAGQLTEAEGTCARAHGPGSPFRGGSVKSDAPEGHGCRACWLNVDTPIFYQEH